EIKERLVQFLKFADIPVDIEPFIEIATTNPSFEESAMFDDMVDLILSGQYDAYVFDTAPVAHTYRLLGMSKVYNLWLNKMIKSRQESMSLRTKLSFRKEKIIQELKKDPLLISLAGTKKKTEEAREILTDSEKTAFFFVTLPLALPIAVIERFITWVQAFQIPIGVVIVYEFYVKWFDRSVVQSDPNRPTPAHTYLDGVEFFPSNKYVMLGWHWKSIAALGPVTGPALAIVWGWLPGFLWILIGNSLLGWLHDYNSMVSSVRNEGASLGPLTYQLIGTRARKVLVAFLAFYSILIFAAFLGALLPVVKGTGAGGAAAMVSFLLIATIGVASGFAIFRAKINVVAVTGISL